MYERNQFVKECRNSEALFVLNVT